MQRKKHYCEQMTGFNPGKQKNRVRGSWPENGLPKTWCTNWVFDYSCIYIFEKTLLYKKVIEFNAAYFKNIPDYTECSKNK